jgi:iron complex transport system substrate-binding protein
LAAERIVSVGTSVTESLCALGVAKELVGVDGASKTNISDAAALPSVGAFRTISAEGIVSLRPTQVFLAFDTGLAEAIKQLRDAGVPAIVVPRNYTLAEVKQAVRFIAAKLHIENKGEEVARSIDHDMQAVTDLQRSITVRPKVLFCSFGPNAPGGYISGTNTRIDELIRLAGGVNPIRSFEGVRPMTDEGVIAAAPDILLMTERGFERAGGIEGVRKLPGVELTPAGRNRRIVAVSDIYFQGFGPGIGKAVLALTREFHPELR